jgi:hypothetical protein
MHAAGWRHSIGWEEPGRDSDGAPEHDGWKVHTWRRGTAEITLWRWSDTGEVYGGPSFYPRGADVDSYEALIHIGIDWLRQATVQRLRRMAEALDIVPHRAADSFDGDVGYVGGLRQAARWLRWLATGPASTGLDPETMRRLIDGADAMATSATKRLGVDEEHPAMTVADPPRATHPMEYPDTGLPVSAARMRQRVADIVGDDEKARQALDEMSHWASRCADAKNAGGDPEGSDHAMWMYAVTREVEDDPYADSRPPDGECCCGGCIGMGPCDDDLGRSDEEYQR